MSAPVVSETRSWRDRIGHMAEALLVFMSGLAVALFVFNHFITDQSFIVFGLPWAGFQRLLQTTIWLAFVLVFFGYGLTSQRHWLDYSKKWWLESVILVTWAPFQSIISGHLELGAFLTIGGSFQMLALVGSLAHIVRIARWTNARFNENAFVVIGVGTLTMVVLASALLMVVEPQTYKSFEETAYSVFFTAMTMGPALPPTTSASRLIFFLIASGGVVIVALFIGVVREYVQRMFGHRDISDHMLLLVKSTHEAVQRLPQPAAATAESQEETIALLRAQVRSQEETIALLRRIVTQHAGDVPNPEVGESNKQ